jgi:drug/metabolite transporter (DMT)-like permease
MTSEYFAARLPLFYVFLSGIGFSFQTLIIKVLAEGGFHASFQCIFFRGFTQFLLASYFVYFDEDRRSGKGPKLFGNTSYVRFMLFMRSFIGFGGIAFSFLAVELIPMGDATVLIMLSPLITSILSYFILAEPWRLPELIATIVSLAGVVMVAKPPAIFGGSTVEPTSFYTGVVMAWCRLCPQHSRIYSYEFSAPRRKCPGPMYASANLSARWCSPSRACTSSDSTSS